MNYITSCPKCDTQFLLSDEHIKAQRGKVQCGHCEHVFNAKNRLVAVSDEPENNPQSQPEAAETDVAASANIEYLPLTDRLSSSNTDTPTSIERKPFNDTYTEYVANPEINFTNQQTENLIEDNLSANSFFINDLTTDVNFTKVPRKKRGTLILLSVLFLLLGLLQTVFFMRTQIAAYYPEFKPLMTQLCDKVGCTIALPKHLESIVIGESDMQEHESYQSVINFSTSIVNNAAYIQAFPSIELTLTNADDNAVIRKIISPKDYLPTNSDVHTGIAAHEEVRVKLPVYVNHEVVTGYRVQLIY